MRFYGLKLRLESHRASATYRSRKLQDVFSSLLAEVPQTLILGREFDRDSARREPVQRQILKESLPLQQ